ncbi:alpha/beta fold hydrolase [Ectopseudomonas hydrolytica]|uniref:alpha/beta fold hydrolase n=1 Tax=Ectopseudomonas hydrolytica TaxID=2493633 RepID=UPI0018A6EEB0|nr:alpha/beta fold hydrolase [Pseudomonas hydrolytica]MBF8159869.1 alpha/beta fold hydrolase [Pseudomonas mendocina]UTH32365.1 alpha/beta fold hydrolase [Pseudomonas hydrolytica]UZZ11555.1 alpha/beta fold hydrolase [Pseudomonas mendocina]
MKRLAHVLLGLLLVFGLTLAGFVALNWAPDRPLDELQARWAPPPSQFVELDGLSVHLRDQGRRDDPEPIVLLHGTSASLHTWEGWVAELAKQRRVISLDLPGFGLTGPFPDGDYRLERYTGFLLTLLDRLQVSRAVLVGNSFGGQLTWRFALVHPERSARLVLVDAAGYPRNAESVPIGFRLAGVPALAPVMSRLLPRVMIESSLRNVYGDPDKVDDELVERYYQLTLREGNRQALRQRFAQAPSGELHERIGELQLPTLIIWGGRDRLIPPDNAERFAADIAGSQLVLFDDLGHVPQEEDPQRTVAVLLAFLAR